MQAAALSICHPNNRRARSAEDANPILDRLLTIHEVRVLTSLSKTSIYRKMAAGTFPLPLPIGTNRVAWSAMDLQLWRASCREQSSSATPAGAAAA